jgi:hypothetical protein
MTTILLFLLALSEGREARVEGLSLLAGDEAALREAFDKEIKSKEAKHRVEAVKKLAGAKEEKSIERLVHSLKDAELEVRKAAAAVIEGATDGAGLAVKPLGEILVDKKDDLDLRKACAKALAKSRYKAEPFIYFFKTISSIDREERQFHEFGAEVTFILNRFTGKSFGTGKDTPERWSEWWIDNKEALQQEDAKTREEWKKENK